MTEEEAFEILKLAYKDGVSIRTENWGVRLKDWDFLSQDIAYAKENIDKEDKYAQQIPIFAITATHFNFRGKARDLGEFYIKVTEALVTLGANVNIRNDLGMMPLHWYIRSDNQYVAHFLIDYSKTDITALDNYGNKTPIILAATCSRRSETIVKLFNRGAIPTDKESGNEVVQRAIRKFTQDKKEKEAFKILKSAYTELPLDFGDGTVLVKWNFLSQDIDYAKTKINEDDPAIKAKPIFKIDRTHEAGYAKVIKALIILGAKVNIRDTHGTMPLHHYIIYDNRDLVYSLIDHSDADLNAIDEYSDKTPLHLACACMKGLEPIKKLLENGADPTINNAFELWSIKQAVREIEREKALSQPSKNTEIKY
jgi:ankyrin repeat protein